MDTTTRLRNYLKQLVNRKNRVYDEAHRATEPGSDGEVQYLTGPQARRVKHKMNRETKQVETTLKDWGTNVQVFHDESEHETLNRLDVKTLRKTAAQHGITGRSTMKKAELIDAIVKARAA